MLKKAKFAFLLIMALVFAVQSIPVAQAEVIDKLTVDYLFDSLGDAVNYGAVAITWQQDNHAETSACVDVLEKLENTDFSNSDNTYFHALNYSLEAEISAPSGKSLDQMQFALYRQSGTNYVRCEGTEKTVSGNVSTTTLTWDVPDDYKNERLFVFQTKGDGYVAEGATNTASLVVSYGPSIAAAAQNEIYLGKIVFPNRMAEGSAMGVYNEPYDHSPAMVLGKETKVYQKNGSSFDPLDHSVVSANGIDVYVNYYYPDASSETGYIKDYIKLDNMIYVNGHFELDGNVVNVVQTNREGYAASLVEDTLTLSKELARMNGGEISEKSVPPKGPSTVTGPVDSDGYFVSLYEVEIGNDCIFSVKDDMGEWLGRVDAASQVGIPIQENEYIVFNLICPTDENGNPVAKVEMGDSGEITYFYRDGQTQGEKVSWGKADSNSSQRVIFNYVYSDANGILQPYTGIVEPKYDHGGTLLVPAGRVELHDEDHNGAIIAKSIYNDQEIHQRTLAPKGRKTWVKMDGGYITLEKASLGYDWGDGEWKDMSANTSLAGAVFGVYSSESCSESSLVTTMTTNDKGVAASDMIAAGTYWVKEITPLKDHELLDDVFEVQVTGGETNRVLPDGYNDRIGGYNYYIDGNRIYITGPKLVNQQNNGYTTLRIVKNDELGNVLPGAVFGIYSRQQTSYFPRPQYSYTLITSATTNRNGVAILENVPLSYQDVTYYIREISAPDGYLVGSRDYMAITLKTGDRNQMITVDGNGNAEGKAFVNKIVRGKLALKKVSQDGSALENAEFTIYTDEACTTPIEKDSVLKTNKEGLAESKDLLPGTYYVLETKAPAGHKLPTPNNPYTVKVVSGKVVDVATNAQIDRKENSTGIVNQQVISISGTKAWHDDDNKWGVRPQSIKVNLVRVKYNPGGSSYTEHKTSATLDASNNWSFSFTDLPRFDGTEEIEYRVEEQMDGSVSNNYYTYATAETDDQGNMTVEIANSIKKTKINGQKRWEDTVQNEPSRPNSIKFTLYQLVDGKEVQVFDQWGNPLVSTAYPGQYTFGFENLPSYDANGNQAKYVVKEEESDKYVVVSNVVSDPKEDENGNATIEITLVNRLTVPLRGTKVWNDNSNALKLRPDNVKLMVFRLEEGSDEPKPVLENEYTVVWDKETNSDVWTWEIQGLPKYGGRDKNKLCSYYVIEEPAKAKPQPGVKPDQAASYQDPVYSNPSSNVTDRVLDGGTITNSMVGRIRLYKENEDGLRLNKVAFDLYKEDGTYVDRYYTEKTGSEEGKLTIWPVAYGRYYLLEAETLDGYVLSNEKYWVTVDSPFSEPSDIENGAPNKDNKDNLNVVINKKETASGSIILTKTDADTGEKLSGAVFTVYSDKACTTSTSVGNMEEDTNNPGVYTLDELTVGQTYYVKETSAPTQTAAGDAGTYQFAPDAVYQVVVTGENTLVNNGTVTNKAITSVSVEKVWNDNNNAANKRPANIEVQLKKNGTAVGEAVTLPFTRPDNTQSWSYTWENLDKYVKNADGTFTQIVYTVDEVEVPENYIKTVATEGNAVTITNTYVASVSVPFSAKKTLDGVDCAEGKFTFKMEGEKIDGVATVTNGANGVVTFPEINFTLADMVDTANGGYLAERTITYHIYEEISEEAKNNNNTLNGVVYDDSHFYADVKLTFTNNTLGYTVTYREGDAPIEGGVPVFANTTEKVNISVTKVWEDKNNASGKRPDSIDVQLKKNGTAEGSCVTLPTETGWSYTWENLPKYDSDGEKITYTVEEGVVEGYTKDIACDSTNGNFNFTITNTYSQQFSVSVPVKKTVTGTESVQSGFEFELMPVESNSPWTKDLDWWNENENPTVTVAPDALNAQDEDPLVATTNFGPFTYTNDYVTDWSNRFIYLVKEKSTTTDKNWKYDDRYYWLDYRVNENSEFLLYRVYSTTAEAFEKASEEWAAQWDESEPSEYDNLVKLWRIFCLLESDGLSLCEDAQAAEFVNTYVSAETEIALTKKLDGQLSATEFDFTLTPKTEGDKNQAATVKNSATGGIVFGLKYGKADMGKTYVYEIAETPKAGYYCDSTVYTVTVAVGANIDADGNLPLTVTYKKGNKEVAAADLVFENASAIEADLTVEKTLTTNANVDNVVKTYRFTLTPTYDDATEQAKTIDVDVTGTASPLTGSNKFELSFAAPGTYTYTVAETVASELLGYTYDESVYTVTYEVELKEGRLQVAAPQITLNGTAADKLAFTNEYKQEAGRAALHAKKVFTNGDLSATQFIFELLDKDGNAVLDAEGDAITATSDKTGEVIFPALSYDKAGTYEYVIKEKIPDNASTSGIVYDGTEHSVTVKVEPKDGKLDATVTYAGGKVPTFTNRQLSTKAQLAASKTFEGGIMTKGQFTFELLDKDGKAVLDANNQPITATNAVDGSIVFPELTYTATGEYEYIIKEQIPENQGNIAYDKASFPVTVTVTRVGNELKAETTYTNGAAEFTNEQLSATGKVYVKKNFANNNAVAGDYTFTITPVDNAPALANNTLTLTFGETTTEASGMFQLPTYTERGIYQYTVQESNATKNPSIIYDSTEHTVTVTVERNDNDELVATVTSSNKQITEQAPIVFTNTKIKAGEAVIRARKTLDGDATLQKDQFTFRLLDSKGDVVEETTNDDTGLVTFDTIHYSVATEETYTIVEVMPKGATAENNYTVNGMTYDPKQHTVKIEVRQVGSELVATVTYDGTSTEAPVFENTYDIDKVGELTLNVTKTMTGRPFQSGDSFTFELTGSNGAPMPKVNGETVDEVIITPTSGTTAAVNFGEINFTEADLNKIYTYTIVEVMPKGATAENNYTVNGVTYDTTEYTVQVKVTEGEDALIVTPAYAKDGMVTITNTYTANGELLLTGTKEVKGVSTVAEYKNAFTFGVFDASGAEIATGTNDEKGNIAFSRIAYTLDQVGTYEYTVKETGTKLDAAVSDKYIVETDKTKYTIQVSVVNNTATGNLDVTWSIKEPDNATGLKFENKFKLRKGIIGVWKVDSKFTADEKVGLAGAEFTVYTDEACQNILMLNGQKAIITTSETGGGSLTGVPFGTYWVKETKAPQHYKLDNETKYKVTVEKENVPAVVNGEFVTNKKMAKLMLVKSDRLNEDKKLPGAEYTLFTEEACENILVLPDGTPAVITTGENGMGELEGVPAGTYWVKETKAPTGYEVDPEPKKVVVGEETNPDPVEVSDYPLRGALSLSKTVVASSEVTDTFLFDIELTLATDDPIVGSYKATLNGAETDDVTFAATENGAKATVELKDGETLTIIGLRSGVSYTVTEQPNSRYDVTVNGAEATAATGTITDNGHSIVKYQNTLKETGFTVEKVWLGEDAGEIKLTLYANGVAMDPQPEVTRDGNTYSYENLVMKDENGEEIVYTVKETAMAGYTTTYQNVAPNADKTDAAYNGGKIINQAMTTFAVKKEWSGMAQGEKAPAIQLTLYCNGKVYTAATPTPDKDGWYTYADLPAYVDGEVAVYTVKEQPVTGFTTTYINKGENAAVTDCAYNGSTIVNSKIPQTGDNTPLTLWMLTTLLAACGLLGVMATLRKREN